MALHTPILMQPTSTDPDLFYTAQEFRNYTRTLCQFAAGVDNFEGVISTAALAVTAQSSPNFTVQVAVGRCFIRDDEISDGGLGHCWNDAAFTLSNASLVAPGSGTTLFRIIARMRNKFENGTWSTYDWTPDVVAGTTGGNVLPSEPGSAITLAQVSIASGQANISNSNITDFRQVMGPVAAYKTSDTTRTSTTLSNDPDLQLTNLAANAVYRLSGGLFYEVGSGTDLKFGWTVSSGTSMSYQAVRQNASGGTGAIAYGWGAGDVPTADGLGASQLASVGINGLLNTGAAPASAKLQWAANTNTGFNCTMKANSALFAIRIA